MQLLPGFLMPDDQPGDWYGWTTVAYSHSMLGLTALAPLRWTLGRDVAWSICLACYIVLELLQLAVGGSLLDGLTDALFVVSGMMLANEALRQSRGGFLVTVGFITAAVIVGIAVRL